MANSVALGGAEESDLADMEDSEEPRQLWQLVNLDKNYYPGSWRTLYDIFRYGFVEIKWIVRPVIPSVRLWSMSNRLLEIISHPTTSPLLKLPPELILYIFEQCDSIVDMLMLCLVHEILGALGEPLVYAYAAKVISNWSWAGDRLMYIGDKTRDTDYPPDTQEDILRDVARYAEEDADEYATRAPHSFWHICQYEWENPLVEGPDDLDVQLWDRSDVRLDLLSVYPEGRPPKDKMRGHSSNDWTYIEAEARRFQSTKNVIQAMYKYTDDEDKLVLCNITKAEYIRGDAVKKLYDMVPTELQRVRSSYGSSFRIFRRIDLETMLGIHICWSSESPWDATRDPGVEAKLVRGRWAGDRFEVVPLEYMRSGIAWRDVSQEALEWFAEIVKACLL